MTTDELIRHYAAATDLPRAQVEAAIPKAIDAVYSARDGAIETGQTMHDAGAAAAIAALKAVADTVPSIEDYFTDLGPVGPVGFHGGVIVLQGNGCPGCGNGFWTEGDDARRLKTGTPHHCPHCGERRWVTS